MQQSTITHEITGTLNTRFQEILSDGALEFLYALHRNFYERRLALLDARKERGLKFASDEKPCFNPDTAHIRTTEWRCADLPEDLLDRRVEITGPVDRKMVINALNAGAKVFMADFEDSTAPTWKNIIEGQINLRDAVNKSISHTSATGKIYELKNHNTVLMVRPRGWHLEEKHIKLKGKRLSASLVDFGLFFWLWSKVHKKIEPETSFAVLDWAGRKY